LAITSGRAPNSLLGDLPGIWDELDLEVIAQWKQLKETKCPGCGRPMSQHTHNPLLGRAEAPEDYTAWSWDCPAQQAIATGQSMWRQANSGPFKEYYDGKGPDPGLGVFWLAQGYNEPIPE